MSESVGEAKAAAILLGAWLAAVGAGIGPGLAR